MTDDDEYEVHRDGQAMVPHRSDPLDGETRRPYLATAFCGTCRLFHDGFTACAVARAAAEALIIDVGDELRDDDLAGVDRPALLRALRLRGISLESDGAAWRAVETVAP